MKGLHNQAWRLLAAFALASVSWAVVADASVTSRLEALQVSADASGTESFAAAGEVKPGDLIEYRLIYENAGKDPASQLAVNGPIPKGTVYVPGTAISAVKNDLKFSYDGGKSWVVSAPLRVIRGADGKASEQPAPPEEITNIEWLVREPLKPGSQQAYRYRVRVTAVQPSK